MNKVIVLFALTVTLSFCIHAQDPVVTDGDKYKAILENDEVRVLEYTDKPGEKTNSHHHPDFVLYALDSFTRRLTFGDGKQIEREFKKGDVMWMKDQIHIGENIGTTETHVLIVELKPKEDDTADTAKVVPYDDKWKEEGKKLAREEIALATGHRTTRPAQNRRSGWGTQGIRQLRKPHVLSCPPAYTCRFPSGTTSGGCVEHCKKCCPF